MSKSSELDKTVKTYLINCFDFSYCDIEPKTLKDQISAVQQEFESTYCYEYNFRRYGSKQNILAEWLKGLPSICTIAFTNYDILQLAIKWRSIPDNYTEKQADKILDNYFNFMSAKLMQLFNGYRIPKI